MSDPAPNPSRTRNKGRVHPPRPADLVALVTFNGRVNENQAVTRERLARPTVAPHPLNSAIEQWLGRRRRRTWIDVRGRRITGIATARELCSSHAWVIDTLVDASTGADEGAATALLRQAAEEATRHRVTRVLLRTPSDGTALPEALRAGFKPALSEQMWSGTLLTGDAVQRPGAPDRDAGRSEIAVRETCGDDALALFQLYNRALPVDGRQALALTLEEWQDIQERRWLGRGSREYVALDGSRVCAALRLAPGGEVGQFDLLADAAGSAARRRCSTSPPGGSGAPAASSLWCRAAPPRWSGCCASAGWRRKPTTRC